MDVVPWREVSKTFQVSELSVNSSFFLMGREGKDVVDSVIAGVVFDQLVSLLVLLS